ncbi:MAG: hypothetical protein KBT06_00800 [Prevotellaceae bacterium]|nr:hypothetical protein [Candidatus Colivivens equi]
MKKKILLVLSALFSICMVCYSEDVYLSVAMPQNCPLDNNAKTLLKNKILDVVTTQGMTTIECSAIAIIPEIVVSDEKTVEGGMRNINVQQLDVTLMVCNVVTNSVLKTFNFTSSGEGYSISEAKKSAIKKFNFKSSDCVAFISSLKTVIADYYQKYTSTIISKAQTLASQNQFDEALALLATYPENLDGYTQVSEVIKSIFDQNKTLYCSQLIQSARQSFSLRDFEKAAETLALVDDQYSCASDAKKLLSEIKQEMDKQHQEDIVREKALMESSERIELQRITAEREKVQSDERLQSQRIAADRDRIKSDERLQSQLIDAARDVSKEYFKKQNIYSFFW